MKSRTKLILFILTAVVVSLPLLQQQLRIFPFKKLAGVEVESPKPQLSFKNWTSQRFQRQSEAYLQQHYGFREPLTRFYNQYLWDFFDMSNLLSGNWIQVSDDGWYFESQNVREYYEGNAEKYAKDSLDMINKMNGEVFRLYQIQHLLEDYGTHLFVLLIPGKEMIYPEKLPTEVPYQKKPHLSAYDYFKTSFDKAGIHYIDIRSWFQQAKDTADYLLFPQTGTHWSNLAAMRVADSLIGYMEQAKGIQMNHFSVGPRYEATLHPDDDLEQLLNLIRPLEKAPNYYAETRVIEKPGTVKPTLITIGDSFYWNIIEHTPFKDIFQALPYWYYFSTVYFDEPAHHISELDLLDEVLDADFVMLSYSSTQLYKMSDGFTQQLLTELCYDPEEIAAKKEWLMNDIRHQKAWFADLQRRVEAWGTDLEEALRDEADLALKKSPAQYLPALRDSIPTKRSTKAQQHYGIQ